MPIRGGQRSLSARRIGRRIERPPAHWSVLALGLGALLVLLFAQGISTNLTGASGTPKPSGHAVLKPNEVLLAAHGDRLVPRGRPPGHRVALTFDDGPSPTWTPRIAVELKRLGVPATFFVVGDHVVEHPGIVNDLVSAGFEIGNHTFSHAGLTSLAGWQRDLQISLT